MDQVDRSRSPYGHANGVMPIVPPAMSIPQPPPAVQSVFAEGLQSLGLSASPSPQGTLAPGWDGAPRQLSFGRISGVTPGGRGDPQGALDPALQARLMTGAQQAMDPNMSEPAFGGRGIGLQIQPGMGRGGPMVHGYGKSALNDARFAARNPLTGTGLPPGLLPSAVDSGAVPLTGPTAFRFEDPNAPKAPPTLQSAIAQREEAMAKAQAAAAVSASAAFLPGGAGFGVAPVNAQPTMQDAFKNAATSVALSEAAPKAMPKPVIPPRIQPPVPVFAEAKEEDKEPQGPPRELTEEEKKEAEEAAKRTLKLKEIWDHQRTLEGKEGYFEEPSGYVITGGATGSYTVVDTKCLGVGMFASVYRCKLKETDPSVAIKVIRYQDFFRKFADREVETLLTLRDNQEKDFQGASFCCRLMDHFIHKKGEKEHLCMVFEALGRNMRDLGRVPLREAILYGHQLLCALRFLHDQCQLAHCDVKPDNLLLAKDGLTIRLCDFGTARNGQRLAETDEIQPMFYRAPELILGAPRNAMIDTWGAGCTLYEFCCGQILCRGCLTLHEVLNRFMQFRGPPSKVSLRKGRRASTFFTAQVSGVYFQPPVGGLLPITQFKKETMQTVIQPHIDFGDMQAPTDHEQATAKMRKILGSMPAFEGQRTQGMKKKQVAESKTEGEKKLSRMSDLLEKLLEMDPAERLTAKAASEHIVFKEVKSQVANESATGAPEEKVEENKEETKEEKKEEVKDETKEEEKQDIKEETKEATKEEIKEERSDEKKDEKIEEEKKEETKEEKADVKIEEKTN